jgi:tripartite-type tricarboxylate transporter receptor subunit TctC
VVTYLNREIVQALKAVDPKRLANAGVEIVGSSPEEFAAFMKSEMTRMGEVMKGASFSN